MENNKVVGKFIIVNDLTFSDFMKDEDGNDYLTFFGQYTEVEDVIDWVDKMKDLNYYANKFEKLTNENKKLKLQNKELRKQLNLLSSHFEVDIQEFISSTLLKRLTSIKVLRSLAYLL